MSIPSAVSLIFLLAAVASSETPTPFLILGARNTRLGEAHLGPTALSPDGRLALAAADGFVELIDPETREVRFAHQPPFEAGSIRFLGKHRLIGVGKTGRVASWDAETGGSSVTLRLNGREYEFPALSADGRRIAFISASGVISVIDAGTGKKLSVLGRPSDDFLGRPLLVALSPDGSWAASGDWLGGVKVWRVETARVVWSTRAFSGAQALVSRGAAGPNFGAPNAVVSFAFSPNGRLLAASGREGVLFVFDVASGKLMHEDATAGGDSCALTFHPDGRSLIAGGGRGGLKRIRVPHGGDIFSIEGTTGYREISISTDGRRLVALDNERFLTTLDIRTGFKLGTGTTRTVWRAEYSRDGSLLAAGGSDGAVEIYSMPKGKRIFGFQAHQEPIMQLALSPDASLLATIGSDLRLRVWNVASGKKTWEAATAGISFANRFAFAPDGRTLITGDKNTLVAWNARSGKRLKEFASHPGEVEDIAISPDGRYAATGCDDTRIRLWDIRSGKQLFAQPAVPTRYNLTTDVMFTPDGRQLVGRVRNGGPLYRLSVPDGRILETVKLDRGVRATILSDDGRLAVSQDDSLLTRWTAFFLDRHGERKFVFQDQLGAGEMVALSPDGKHLITAGEDGLLRVWSVPP